MRTGYKFWRWLESLSKKKAASHFKHSRKCPNCNMWTADIGGCAILRDADDDEMVEIMTCLQCGHDSRWRVDSMLPYLEQPAEQERTCEICCHRCAEGKPHPDFPGFPLSSACMILCAECGNKRCPKATDHRLQCTGSNEPGQDGSVYGSGKIIDTTHDDDLLEIPKFLRRGDD